MEFQAYPQTPCRKDVHTLLRVQNVLHRNDSILLPGCLLLVGSALLVYQHMTDDDTGRHSVRNFLGKILISMLPLVVLEKKIWSCAEPVGLFARMSSKVLIMHALFLMLRVASKTFFGLQVDYMYYNVAALVAVCAMLPTVFGLRPSLATVYEHRDVLGLALVALTVAVLEIVLLTNYSSWGWHRIAKDVVITGSDYLEILSFVPAVWMAYRQDSSSRAAAQPADLADSQRRALCLFVFLVCFYVPEDLGHSFKLYRKLPLVATAHLAHFVLLLDFAGFLLAHLYDPEKIQKLRGALLTWVVDACAV